MPQATDIVGTVFKNDSVILLARVVGEDAAAITQADISSAKYSVYSLGDDDPDAATAVDDHEDVALTVVSVIFDTLQTDAVWTVDSTGYNFKHVLDVSTDQAFAVAGVTYRVRVELTPTSGQVIVVRFRLECV